MSVDKILAFYQESPELKFPMELPGADGIKINALKPECKKCNKPTADVRGTLQNHATCTEFTMAGRCDPCKCVTQAKVRVYTDGRLLHLSDSGWNEHMFLKKRNGFITWLSSLFS